MRVHRFLLAVLALSFCLTGAAHAGEAVPNAEDPVVEAHMMAIASELRCLVCQNQTLADSQAGLAEDFRREIRDLIKAGKSDKEIIAFLTDRYGDFVRYRPPFKSTTVLLWLGPFLLMAGAVGGLVLSLRRRREEVAEAAPLTDAEKKRLKQLLKDGDS